jgi:DNA-directed RNA polymerase specialized sigma24 family protein
VHLGVKGAAIAAEYALARHAREHGYPVLGTAHPDSSEFHAAIGRSRATTARGGRTYDSAWSLADVAQIVEYVEARTADLGADKNGAGDDVLAVVAPSVDRAVLRWEAALARAAESAPEQPDGSPIAVVVQIAQTMQRRLEGIRELIGEYRATVDARDSSPDAIVGAARVLTDLADTVREYNTYLLLVRDPADTAGASAADPITAVQVLVGSEPVPADVLAMAASWLPTPVDGLVRSPLGATAVTSLRVSVNLDGLLTPASAPMPVALFWGLLGARGVSRDEAQRLALGMARAVTSHAVLEELRGLTWDEVFPDLSQTIDYLYAHLDWTPPRGYDHRVRWLEQRVGAGRLRVVGPPTPATVGHLIAARTVPDEAWSLIADDLATGGEIVIGGGAAAYLSADAAFLSLFNRPARSAQLENQAPVGDFYVETGEYNLGGFTTAEELTPDGQSSYRLVQNESVEASWEHMLPHAVGRGLALRAPILEIAHDSREWREIHSSIRDLDHHLIRHWLWRDETFARMFALYVVHLADPAASPLYVELGADRTGSLPSVHPGEAVAAEIIRYFDRQIDEAWTARGNPLLWASLLNTATSPLAYLVRQFEADGEFFAAVWAQLGMGEITETIEGWDRLRRALSELWRSPHEEWHRGDQLAAHARTLVEHSSFVTRTIDIAARAAQAIDGAPAELRIRARWAWRDAQIEGRSFARRLDPTRYSHLVQLGGNAQEARFGILLLAARLIDALGLGRAQRWMDRIVRGLLPDGQPFAGMALVDAAQRFIDATRPAQDDRRAIGSAGPARIPLSARTLDYIADNVLRFLDGGGQIDVLRVGNARIDEFFMRFEEAMPNEVTGNRRVDRGRSYLLEALGTNYGVAVAHKSGRPLAAVDFQLCRAEGETWINPGFLGSAHLGVKGAAVAAEYALARYALAQRQPVLGGANADARHFHTAIGRSAAEISRPDPDGEGTIEYDSNWSVLDLAQIVEHVERRIAESRPGSATTIDIVAGSVDDAVDRWGAARARASAAAADLPAGSPAAVAARIAGAMLDRLDAIAGLIGRYRVAVADGFTSPEAAVDATRLLVEVAAAVREHNGYFLQARAPADSAGSAQPISAELSLGTELVPAGNLRQVAQWLPAAAQGIVLSPLGATATTSVRIGVEQSGTLAPQGATMALALFWALLDAQGTSGDELVDLVSGLAQQVLRRRVVDELVGVTWEEALPDLPESIDYLHTYQDWTPPADYAPWVEWLNERVQGRLHIVGRPSPTVLAHLIAAQTVPEKAWQLLAPAMQAGAEFTIGGGHAAYLRPYEPFFGLFNRHVRSRQTAVEMPAGDFAANTGEYTLGGFFDTFDLTADGRPAYGIVLGELAADVAWHALPHQVGHGLSHRTPILGVAHEAPEWREINLPLRELDYQLLEQWVWLDESYAELFARYSAHLLDPTDYPVHVAVGVDTDLYAEPDRSVAGPAEESATLIIDHFDRELARPWTAPVDPANWRSFRPTELNPLVYLARQFDADPQFYAAVWPDLQIADVRRTVADWDAVGRALDRLWRADSSDPHAVTAEWRTADELAAAAQTMLDHGAVVERTLDMLARSRAAIDHAPAHLRVRAWWAWREEQLKEWSYDAKRADPTRSWQHLQLGGTPRQAQFGTLLLASRLVDALGPQHAGRWMDAVLRGVLPDGSPVAGLTVTEAAQHFIDHPDGNPPGGEATPPGPRGDPTGSDPAVPADPRSAPQADGTARTSSAAALSRLSPTPLPASASCVDAFHDAVGHHFGIARESGDDPAARAAAAGRVWSSLSPGGQGVVETYGGTFYSAGPDVPRAGRGRLAEAGRLAVTAAQAIIAEFLGGEPRGLVGIHTTSYDEASGQFTAHLWSAHRGPDGEIYCVDTTPATRQASTDWLYTPGWGEGQAGVIAVDLYALAPDAIGARPVELAGLAAVDIAGERPTARGLDRDGLVPGQGVASGRSARFAVLPAGYGEEILDTLTAVGLDEHALLRAITNHAAHAKSRDEAARRELAAPLGSSAPDTAALRAAYHAVSTDAAATAEWIKARVAASAPGTAAELAADAYDRAKDRVNKIKKQGVEGPRRTEAEASLRAVEQRFALATEVEERSHDLRERLDAVIARAGELGPGERGWVARRDVLVFDPLLWQRWNAGAGVVVPGERVPLAELRLRADAIAGRVLAGIDTADRAARQAAIRDALLHEDGVLLGVLGADYRVLDRVGAASSAAYFVRALARALIHTDIQLPGVQTRDDFSAFADQRRPRWYGVPDGSGLLEDTSGGRFEEWVPTQHRRSPEQAAAAVAHGYAELEQRMRATLTDTNPLVFAYLDVLRADAAVHHSVAIAYRDPRTGRETVTYLDPTTGQVSTGHPIHGYPTVPGATTHSPDATIALAATLVGSDGIPQPSGRPRGFSNARPLTPQYRAALTTEQTLAWEQQRHTARTTYLNHLIPTHRAIATTTTPTREPWLADLHQHTAGQAGPQVTPTGPNTFTLTTPAATPTVQVLYTGDQPAIHIARHGTERDFVLTLDHALHADPDHLRTTLLEHIDTISRLLSAARTADTITAQRTTTATDDQAALRTLLARTPLTPLQRHVITCYAHGVEVKDMQAASTRGESALHLIASRARRRVLSVLAEQRQGELSEAQRNRLRDVLTGRRVTLTDEDSVGLDGLARSLLAETRRDAITRYARGVEIEALADQLQLPGRESAENLLRRAREILLAYLHGRYPALRPAQRTTTPGATDGSDPLPTEALIRINDFVVDGVAASPLRDSDRQVLAAIVDPLMPSGARQILDQFVRGVRLQDIAEVRRTGPVAAEIDIHRQRSVIRSYLRGAREAGRLPDLPLWPNPTAAWLLGGADVIPGAELGVSIPDELTRSFQPYLRQAVGIWISGGTQAAVAAALGVQDKTAAYYVRNARQRVLTELWDERHTPWSYQVSTDDPYLWRVVPAHGAPFRIAVDVLPADQLPAGVTATRVWARPTEPDPYRIEISDELSLHERIQATEPVLDAIVTEHIRAARVAELTGDAAHDNQLATAIRVARSITGARQTLRVADRPVFDRLVARLRDSHRELLTRFAHGGEADEVAGQRPFTPGYARSSVSKATAIILFALSDRDTSSATRSERDAFTRIAAGLASRFETALSEGDQSILARLVQDLPAIEGRALLLAASGADADEITARLDVHPQAVRQALPFARESMRLFFAVRGIHVDDSPGFDETDAAALARIADVLTRRRQRLQDADRDFFDAAARVLTDRRRDAMSMYVDGAEVVEIAAEMTPLGERGVLDLLKRSRAVMLAHLSGRYPQAIGAIDLRLRANLAAVRRAADVVSGAARGVLPSDDLPLFEELIGQRLGRTGDLLEPRSRSFMLMAVRGVAPSDISDRFGLEPTGVRVTVDKDYRTLAAYFDGLHVAGLTGDSGSGAEADAEAMYRFIDGGPEVQLTAAQLIALRRLTSTLSPRLRERIDLWASGVSTLDIATAGGLTEDAVQASLRNARSQLKENLTDPGATLASASIELGRGRLLVGLPGGARFDIEVATVSADLLPSGRHAIRAWRRAGDQPRYRIEVSEHVDIDDADAIVDAAGPALADILAERGRMTRLKAALRDAGLDFAGSARDTLPATSCVDAVRAAARAKFDVRATGPVPHAYAEGMVWPRLSPGAQGLLDEFGGTFYATSVDAPNLREYSRHRAGQTAHELEAAGRTAVTTAQAVAGQFFTERPSGLLVIHTTHYDPATDTVTSHVWTADLDAGRIRYTDPHPETRRSGDQWLYPPGWDIEADQAGVIAVDLYGLTPDPTALTGARPVTFPALTHVDVAGRRPDARGVDPNPSPRPTGTLDPLPSGYADAIRERLAGTGLDEATLLRVVGRHAVEIEQGGQHALRELRALRGRRAPDRDAARAAYEAVSADTGRVADWIRARLAAHEPAVLQEVADALEAYTAASRLANRTSKTAVADAEATLAAAQQRHEIATRAAEQMHDARERLMTPVDELGSAEKAMLAHQDTFTFDTPRWTQLNVREGESPLVPGERAPLRLLQVRADAVAAHVLGRIDAADLAARQAAIRTALLDDDGVLLGVLGGDYRHLDPVGAATSSAYFVRALGRAVVHAEIEVPGLQTRDDFDGLDGHPRRRWYGVPDGSGLLEDASGGRFEEWVADQREAAPADAYAALRRGQVELEQRMRDGVTDENASVFAYLDLLRADGSVHHTAVMAFRDPAGGQPAVAYLDPASGLVSDEPIFGYRAGKTPGGQIVHKPEATIAIAAILIDSHNDPLPWTHGRGFSNARPLPLSINPAMERQREQDRGRYLSRLIPSHRALLSMVARSSEAGPDHPSLAARPSVERAPGGPDTAAPATGATSPRDSLAAWLFGGADAFAESADSLSAPSVLSSAATLARGLPDRLRTTVTSWLAGDTPRDIAAALGTDEDTVRANLGEARQRLLAELWDERLTRWTYQVSAGDADSLRVVPPHGAPFRITVHAVSAGAAARRVPPPRTADGPYHIELSADIARERWLAAAEPVIDAIVTEYVRTTRLAELTGGVAQRVDAVTAIRVARAIAGQRVTLDAADRPAFERLVAPLRRPYREMLTRYVHGTEPADLATHNAVAATIQLALSTRDLSGAAEVDRAAMVRIAAVVGRGSLSGLSDADRTVLASLVRGVPEVSQHAALRAADGILPRDSAARRGAEPQTVHAALAEVTEFLRMVLALHGIAIDGAPAFDESDQRALARIVDVIGGRRQTLGEQDRALFESVTDGISDRQRDAVSRYVRGTDTQDIASDMGYQTESGVVPLLRRTRNVLLARLSGRYPLALGGRDEWLRNHSATVRRVADVVTRESRGVLAADDLGTLDEVIGELIEPARQPVVRLSLRDVSVVDSASRLRLPAGAVDIARGEARVTLAAYFRGVRESGLTGYRSEDGPRADAEAIYRVLDGVREIRLNPWQLAALRQLTGTLPADRREELTLRARGLSLREVAAACEIEVEAAGRHLTQSRQRLMAGLTDPSANLSTASIELSAGRLQIALPSGASFGIELAAVGADLLPTGSRAVRAWLRFADTQRYRIEVSDQVEITDVDAIVGAAGPILAEIITEHARMTRLVAVIGEMSPGRDISCVEAVLSEAWERFGARATLPAPDTYARGVVWPSLSPGGQALPDTYGGTFYATDPEATGLRGRLEDTGRTLDQLEHDGHTAVAIARRAVEEFFSGQPGDTRALVIIHTTHYDPVTDIFTAHVWTADADDGGGHLCYKDHHRRIRRTSTEWLHPAGWNWQQEQAGFVAVDLYALVADPAGARPVELPNLTPVDIGSQRPDARGRRKPERPEQPDQPGRPVARKAETVPDRIGTAPVPREALEFIAYNVHRFLASGGTMAVLPADDPLLDEFFEQAEAAAFDEDGNDIETGDLRVDRGRKYLVYALDTSGSVAVAYQDGRIQAAVNLEDMSDGYEEWITPFQFGSAHLGVKGAATAAQYALARYVLEQGKPLLGEADRDARQFHTAIGRSPAAVPKVVPTGNFTYKSNWSVADAQQIVEYVERQLTWAATRPAGEPGPDHRHRQRS